MPKNLAIAGIQPSVSYNSATTLYFQEHCFIKKGAGLKHPAPVRKSLRET
jgi:hypothetical protein